MLKGMPCDADSHETGYTRSRLKDFLNHEDEDVGTEKVTIETLASCVAANEGYIS